MLITLFIIIYYVIKLIIIITILLHEKWLSFVSRSVESTESSMSCSRTSLSAQEDLASPWKHRRRASTYNEAHLQRTIQALGSPKAPRKRSFSFHEESSCRKNEDDSTRLGRKYHDKTLDGPITLPPPCTCPYFGESSKKLLPSSEIVIVSSDTMTPMGNRDLEMGNKGLLSDQERSIGSNRNPEMGLGRNNSARCTEGVKNYEQLTLANSVVTWRGGRRGSSLGKRADKLWQWRKQQRELSISSSIIASGKLHSQLSRAANVPLKIAETREKEGKRKRERAGGCKWKGCADFSDLSFRSLRFLRPGENGEIRSRRTWFMVIHGRLAIVALRRSPRIFARLIEKL